MSIGLKQLRVLHHIKKISTCNLCGQDKEQIVYMLPNFDMYQKLVKQLRQEDINYSDIDKAKWCAKNTMIKAELKNILEMGKEEHQTNREVKK
jgi:hypothetical protein